MKKKKRRADLRQQDHRQSLAIAEGEMRMYLKICTDKSQKPGDLLEKKGGQKSLKR